MEDWTTENFKERLVPKDFFQKDGADYDDTFLLLVLLLFLVAARQNLQIKQHEGFIKNENPQD